MSKSLGLSRSEYARLAWERGLLSYKIYDYQEPLYKQLKGAVNTPDLVKFTLNCSRRYGKSFLLSLLSIEFALQRPGSQIRFAAPTGKALRKIIKPIMKQIMQDCPEDLKPGFNQMDSVYVFKNGSELHMAGTDGGSAENLRGQNSHLNIIDEAGFCTDLDYIVRSILLPQTITTGGKTLLASTPPKTPAHDFVDILRECMLDGHYAEFDIYSNKTLTKPTIDLYAKEAGGYNSSTFKREYLCQIVVDETLSIVPEWDDLYIEEKNRNELYGYFHKYVGMDLGVKDLTAAVFGYYDFPRATIYIEDELELSGPEMTTPLLNQMIVLKERELWGDRSVYRRVADNNNLLLLQDLDSIHNLNFLPTNKDSLEAMVNEMRIMVSEGRVKVHPRCKKLIACLRYGVWESKRKAWARTKSLAHFDHLAALMYLIRNIDKHTNPVPRDHAMDIQTHYIATDLRHNRNHDSFRKAFLR